MPSRLIDVVIADDHKIFREGLKRLLQDEDHIQIVGEADDGDQLLELESKLQPQLLIMDISMPGPGVAAILQELDRRQSKSKTVALTMHLEPSFAKQMLALGMDGYVVKDAAFDELMVAVDTVLDGEQYLSKGLLLQPNNKTDALPNLTERELACLSRAAEGETSKVIALTLGITERTVQFHFANICRKYGVRRRSEAIAVALRHGILALTQQEDSNLEP